MYIFGGINGLPNKKTPKTNASLYSFYYFFLLQYKKLRLRKNYLILLSNILMSIQTRVLSILLRSSSYHAGFSLLKVIVIFVMVCPAFCRWTPENDGITKNYEAICSAHIFGKVQFAIM